MFNDSAADSPEFFFKYFHDRIKPQSCSVHESKVVNLLFELHVQQEDYTTYDVFWEK